MRLICPNCGAQYEVPDGVIPEQGRDVQCSNCGNTWFQLHPDQDRDLAEELAEEQGQHLEDPTEFDTPEEEPAPAPAPAPAPELAPAPSRRELDPAIAELLREEAELESRRRAADTGGLETQPELGLDEPAPDEAARRALEARRRMASRTGQPEPQPEPDPEPEDDDEPTSSRRELLPDIEEINSSLNAEGRRPARASDHAPTGTPLPPAAPSGFRRGFALALLVTVLAWSTYAFAPQISTKVPQLSAPLQGYVHSVDKGRVWLDRQIKALLVKLDAMAAASEK